MVEACFIEEYNGKIFTGENKACSVIVITKVTIITGKSEKASGKA